MLDGDADSRKLCEDHHLIRFRSPRPAIKLFSDSIQLSNLGRETDS